MAVKVGSSVGNSREEWRTNGGDPLTDLDAVVARVTRTIDEGRGGGTVIALRCGDDRSTR